MKTPNSLPIRDPLIAPGLQDHILQLSCTAFHIVQIAQQCVHLPGAHRLALRTHRLQLLDARESIRWAPNGDSSRLLAFTNLEVLVAGRLVLLLRTDPQSRVEARHGKPRPASTGGERPSRHDWRGALTHRRTVRTRIQMPCSAVQAGSSQRS